MIAKPSLLVIDDEELILRCMRFTFPEEEVTLRTAQSAAEGYQSFHDQRPDLVLVDVGLPDQSGLTLFARLRELDSRVPVILMTGHSTADTAIEAMRLGAFDYIAKPLDPDALAALAGRAFTFSRLMRVPAKVPTGTTSAEEESDLLVGNTPAMREVYKSVGRVAPTDATVLILGESGTGKEMVARAIYHYSQRSKNPFLAINCAAIPESLLESELFGHEKGAFTGAERRRIGKFEQCHGGTLLLDEIGDMSPLTQSKVLRVLQDRQFERVGGNETIRADVRLIAATNCDLPALMAAGRFRADLYYRLNVFTIQIPPLRERVEDIALLTDHFLKRFSRELGKEVSSTSPAALAILEAYAWPGNIRELQSVLKQALLRATGPVLVPDFLPAEVRPGFAGQKVAADEPFPDVLRFIRQRFAESDPNVHGQVIAGIERVLLREAMAQAGGNISQAARLVGISRPTLRAKLHALLPDQSRAANDDE